MIKKVSIALVILTLLLAGCSAANRDLRAAVEQPPSAVSPEMFLESAGSAQSPDKSAYALDQSAASVDRLVIKNATLSIAVNDPLKSMDTISRMAETMGGFVVSADMSQQYLSNGIKVPQVSMTIRVPAERLAEALATIKAETDQPIISENNSSQDVTADYTDLNSRLTNLQAAEKQLQEIMASANKTEDVLSVYSQLVSVREQIELIKGQMKYYEEVGCAIIDQRAAARQRRGAAPHHRRMAAGWCRQGSLTVVDQHLAIAGKLWHTPGNPVYPHPVGHLRTHRLDHLGYRETHQERSQGKESPSPRCGGIS